jgi:NAD(P)-dependent dehydrogenase (short-subunit alcohol dehydrogenase family)/pimeloyl-ACP methyl ester carboxylesterase
MTVMTRTVECSDGVKLSVRERGDTSQPTIVLVHGYPDTSGVWDEVADRLEPRFHVVTYDVRGAGESARPRRRSAYRLDQLARDLRAIADAVSPHQPVHVVAHDWGSIQAWEAITDDGAERRFASYTSMSGPCIDHVGLWFRANLKRPSQLPAILNQTRKSWYIAMFQLPLLAPIAWRLGIGKRFGPAIEKLEGLEHSDSYPAPTIALDGARGVQLYRANFFQRLRHPRERRTAVPVQIIVAQKDRYMSPSLANAAKPWVERLWVRDVQTGHWLPRKAPDTVVAAVTDLVDHAEGGDEPRALRRWRAGGAGGGEFGARLVVVTGAGSGIGRETALAFGGLGASVVIADLNEAAARQTVDLVRVLGTDAHPYVVDVSDVTAMEDFAKRVIADHGVPDVVVNNAGIGIAGAFLDTSAADWQRIVDINLLGVVTGCRLFGAAMAERREGGHIVNVASAAAFTPSRTLGAYAATKAAVLMLSECLRAELAGKGIGVSAICPGIINTPITTATHYVGLSDTDAADRGTKVAKQYARRNYPPSKVATAIVKAVRHNTAVVPVTPEAAGARLLSRVSPGAMRRFAKIDAL